MDNEIPKDQFHDFCRECLKKYGSIIGFEDMQRLIKRQDEGYSFEYLAAYYLEHEKIF